MFQRGDRVIDKRAPWRGEALVRHVHPDGHVDVFWPFSVNTYSSPDLYELAEKPSTEVII